MSDPAPLASTGPVAAGAAAEDLAAEAISLRPAAKGLLWLGAGEAIGKAVAFAATAYLARAVGPEGFGVLAFATAISAYFLLAVDFGLGVYGVREVARGGDAARLGGEIIALRLLLAAGSAALLLGATPLLGRPPLASATIRASALLLLSFAVGPAWICQGLERMRAVALAGVVTQVLYAAGIVAAVRAPEHVARVPALQAGAEAGAALLLFALLARARLAPRVPPAPARLIAVARGSLALAGTRVLRVLLYNTDMLILGLLAPEAVVGRYSAAYRVVFALLTLNALMGTALLPLVARARGRDPAVVGAMIGRLGYATVAATLPMALGLALLAGPVVRVLFGAAFAEAALPLALLAWAVLLVPLGENLRRVLWAFHLPARDVRALAVATLVLVGLCLALVPRLGAAGAALATLAAETTIVALSVREVRRAVAPFLLVATLRPPLVAAALMAAAVWPARGLGLAVAIPIGVAVYAAALAAQRGIPAEILRRSDRAQDEGLRRE